MVFVMSRPVSEAITRQDLSKSAGFSRDFSTMIGADVTAVHPIANRHVESKPRRKE